MKVLVVEDEDYLAELLCRSLTQRGDDCLHAKDARQAEELLKDESIEAVTLDLCMPGRDGLSLLEELASERPQLARQTLVITGSLIDAETVTRVSACGAGMLAKPFSLEGLHQAMRFQVEAPGLVKDD
jgi:two-component system OmpR family response regulator